MRPATRATATSFDWVSKTDILRYHRCPYAFWLVDVGEVDLHELAPEFSARLSAGEAFEASVTDTLPVLEPTITLEDIFAGTVTVFGAPTLRNKQLQLVGRPDGIEPNCGALVPVEIKSHLNVTYSDRLELAFYWNLLKPYRSRPAEKRGVIILRDRVGGYEKPVDVELEPFHFDRVAQLVDAVREARTNGIEPSYCRCIVCATRPEVQARLKGRQDLKLVLGIATARQAVLEGCGIRSLDALVATPTETLRDHLRAERHFVNPIEIDRWKAHVTAYRENRIVRFEAPLFRANDFIAIDFEYISEANEVWLIGCRIDVAGESRLEQFWADTRKQRVGAFAAMGEIFDAHPDTPIITWSGKTAEAIHVRQLGKTARRPDIVDVFDQRHVDLYEIALRSFRLPVPTLRLSDVAEYAGFRFTSDVRNGLDATRLYFDYKREKANEKARLRRALLHYNRDDLDALATIATSLFREPRSSDAN